MSSNATEGARPSAAPAGEAATADGVTAAPAEAAPAGAALAEGALATAFPARDVARAGVPDLAPDAASAGGRDAAPAGVRDAGPAEEVADTAAPGDGDAEPGHGFAEDGFGGPDHGWPDHTGPDYAGPEYAGPHYAGADYAGPEYAGAEYAGAEYAGADYGEPEYAESEGRPVSKLAIVALVTGLVALVPVAIASGIAALVGIRRTGRNGHGMAMAGLFLSAAWVIIAAAVITVGAVTHGFHKPVTIKYRQAAVFELHEGDCVNSPTAQLVSILPCSTPHEAEVFATFALPASPWPGTTAIATEASSGCGSRLDGYLNPQLAISLTQSYVYPDQVAWTAGTRTVVCEVRASSGQLTGSVRGAPLAALSARPGS